jgi:hypothetical protein
LILVQGPVSNRISKDLTVILEIKGLLFPL